jgi:radical SAM protein with 4Fe4S-binding SPASM domain
MKADAPTPYSANIEITLACNLSCIHCGAFAGRKRADELTLAELDRFFADLAALGGVEACLLGGEPFLRPDWEEVARAAAERGLNVLFITNGFCVDPRLASRVAGLPRVDRVGVSLDGASPLVHDAIRRKPGSFERAWAALLALRDAGLEVGAITTVSRRNLSELPALRDRLRGQSLTWQIQVASLHGRKFDRAEMLGEREFYQVGRLIARCRAEIPVDELPVAGSHDIGYHSDRLGRYGEHPHWPGCAAGVATVGLLSDGRVKGCLSQSEEFVEGTIRTRPFREIWTDPNSFSRNRRFAPELLTGTCAGCVHGATCRAGCADLAFAASGRRYENPYCFHRIEREGGVPVEEIW